MKKKQVARPYTKIKKKRRKWHDVFITTIVIVLIGGFFAWLVVHIYQQEKSEQEALKNYKATLPAPGKKLDHKLVCMVSDIYHCTRQIPIVVSNKVYYGCNQKSVLELNTDEKMRFAVDPYSKKTGDKSLAFITTSPYQPGSILYFESEENLSNYFKRLRP